MNIKKIVFALCLPFPLCATQVPVITFPLPGEEISDTQPVIQGTAEPGALIYVALDGKLQKLACVGPAVSSISTLTEPTGVWQVMTFPPLSNGEHTLTARAQYQCESSGSTGFNFIVNSSMQPPVTTPAPVIRSPTNNQIFTIQNTYVFGGFWYGTTDNVSQTSINIYKENGDGSPQLIAEASLVPPANPYTWSINPAPFLPNGSHTIFATALIPDYQQSEPSDPVNFTLNLTTPPPFFEIPLADGYVFKTDTPTFEGTVTPGASLALTVDGVDLPQPTIDATGEWSCVLTGTLTDGDHTLSGIAQLDGQNASDPKSITFVVDTTPIVPAKKFYWLNSWDYETYGNTRVGMVDFINAGGFTDADFIFAGFLYINFDTGEIEESDATVDLGPFLLSIKEQGTLLQSTSVGVSMGGAAFILNQQFFNKYKALAEAQCGMTFPNPYCITYQDCPAFDEFVNTAADNLVHYISDRGYTSFCFNIEDATGGCVDNYTPAAVFTAVAARKLKQAFGKDFSISMVPGTYGIAPGYSSSTYRELVNEFIDVNTGEACSALSDSCVDTLNYSIIQNIDFNCGCNLNTGNCTRWSSCTINPDNKIVSMAVLLLDVDGNQTLISGNPPLDGFHLMQYANADTIVLPSSTGEFETLGLDIPLRKMVVHLGSYSIMPYADGQTNCAVFETLTTWNGPIATNGAGITLTTDQREYLSSLVINPDDCDADNAINCEALDIYNTNPLGGAVGPWTTPRCYELKRDYFFRDGNFGGNNIGGGISMWQASNDPNGELLGSVNLDTLP